MDKGARFYRTDLQVHSPRDPNWQGARPKTEGERIAWAKALVEACRKTALDAIAITDHHETVMYPYVRAAADAETDDTGNPVDPERRVVVFPGMELTLALPCQALLLFDADLPAELLALLPGALGLPQPNPAADVGEQAKPLGLNHPNDVEDRLNAHATLKGRFIVLPHVQEGGHKTIIRAGFNQHYQRCYGVGGYVDGDIPKEGTGARKILDGLDPNYGNKPMGVFQTSDSRRADFSTLGKHSSWVKWSRPTAEALRQSCLARQSRIRHEAPKNPAIVIERVEVSASKFLGKLDLFVNPQYNALIGGRGTGKSTLLEYIRWALCAPTALADDGEEVLPDYEKRTLSLIEKTLAAVQGSVRVWVQVRGVPHVVDRRTHGAPEIQIKVGGEQFRPSTSEEVRRLVPVEAYRQKQLSSIGGQPDDVLRFVLAGVARDVSGLDDRLRENGDKMRTAFAEVRAKEKSAADADGLARERESLLQQRDSVRAQLVGMDPGDAEILAKADSYGRERTIAEKWAQELAAAKEAVARAVAVCAAAPTAQVTAGLPDEQVVRAMRDALADTFAAVGAHLAQAVATLESGPGLQLYREHERRLHEQLASAREQFKAARERAQAHEAALKQVDALTKRIDDAGARIEALARAAEGREAAQARFDEAAAAWAAVLAERAEIATKQSERVEAFSHGLIRGKVSVAADLRGPLEMLAELVRGGNVRAARFEALAERIRSQPDPLGSWMGVLEEIRALLGLAPDALPPACPTLRAAGFSDKDLRALSARIDQDAWIRLRVVSPRDMVEFAYRAREGDYIAFADASAGQRATALMRVLLAQEDVPLIIDQPEDDLDNSVIHEVARDIWTAKTKRQLLFASHNANLVVNGDADLIAFFDYSVAGEATSGEIKAQGAIDDTPIRSAITAIMEGGREAFALRRAKYNF